MLELLSNARLYAPRPQGVVHLLIAAGRVLWIGEKIPSIDSDIELVVTDAEGRIVAPGLIDGHAHITGGGGESGYSSAVPALPISRFTGAGVTTAVGLLGTDDTIRNTAQLVAQARSLCEEGLSAYCYTGGYHVPPMTLTGSVRTDIVHIDRIIGVGELAISDHRSSQPTLDELLRIAADAHVAGLMTHKAGIVHLHLGDGERGLALVRDALQSAEIPPRVFNPTHVNRRAALFEEALALVERGCTVDLTAYPGGEDGDGWSAESALLRYYERGCSAERITVSSDGGGCLPVFDSDGRVSRMDTGDPGTLLTTLQRVFDQSVALEVALAAFTSNVANILRLPHKGRLEVGSDADLMVLNEDLTLWGTMARGRWHVRESEILVRGQFEAARK